jgi:hypothetical protein
VYDPTSPQWPGPHYIKPEQVAAVASLAGFKGRALVTAIAISFAEDGTHDVNAKHHNANGTWDIGLWQINSIHLGSNLNYRDLIDPQKNADAAYSISGRGASFNPWTTYQTNAYVPHLPAAHNALTTMRLKGGAQKVAGSIGTTFIGVPNPGSAIRGAVGGVEGALGAIGNFFSELPSLLLRLGKILFGIILLVVAFLVLTKGSVLNAVPAGRALKAVRSVRKAKTATA